MLYWIIISCAIVYIVIIAVDLNCATEENTKWHEGGFLNLGYTTHDHRELTPKDVRLALIWPLRLSWWLLLGVIGIINDVFIPTPLLLFGFRYKNTEMYRAIDRFTMKRI